MRDSNFFDLRHILPSFIIFSLIFLFSLTGSFETIRGVVVNSLESFYSSINYRVQSLQGINYVFDNINSVREENEKLKQTTATLEEEIMRLNRQLEDVSYIFEKGLVNFDPPYNFTPARLLYYDQLREGIVYINKGSNSDISPDDVVVFGEYVIGEIVDVYSNYASVQLIGSSNNEVNVISLGSKTRGILHSDFTDNFEVREILSQDQLGLDEIFVTEGKDGKYPYGLYIGKVERIIGNPAEPTKTAVISNSLDFRKLDNLFVIKFK